MGKKIEEKQQEKVQKQAEPESSVAIKLRPLAIRGAQVMIENMPGSPLVAHAWSQKAINMLREGQQGGGKKRIRDARNPEEDFEGARYRLPDGSDGFPVTTIKGSITDAAHKDLGVEKTLIRKSLFIEADALDARGIPLVRIVSEPPTMREDMVRVGMGKSSLAYRPQYFPWQMTLRLTYDADCLTAETLLNLIERAGYGVGIGEWRPQCNGDWGRFRVKSD